MNNVLIVGRLGQDPDLRITAGGDNAVCKLSVATDESKRVGDKWEKYPEWHKVVVFGRDAENAKKYLVKGSQVCIQGSLKTNKWQDKQGVDHLTTEIIAHRVEYLSDAGERREPNAGRTGSGRATGGGGDYRTPTGGGGSYGGDYGGGGSTSDDDIPFARLDIDWDRLIS